MWQELAKTRENKIFELEHETAILRDEITLLRLEVCHVEYALNACIDPSVVEAAFTRPHRRNTVV